MEVSASSQPFKSQTSEEEEQHYPKISTFEPNQLEPTVEIIPSSSNPNNGGDKIVKKTKKASKLGSVSSSSSASTSLVQKGFRVTGKRKNPKVVGGGRFRGESELDALALPLGMSIAAVVAQVLDRKGVGDERISADHLSLICSSAVKESLDNVFGQRFESFIRNFEKSFGSTLRTLRLINETSLNLAEDSSSHSSAESHSSKVSESAQLIEHGHPSSSSDMQFLPEAIPSTFGPSRSFPCFEEVQDNPRLGTTNRDISLHGQLDQQLACLAPGTLSSGVNNSMLSTFEKSVIEQARSNDLKTFEIGLMMKRLQLEESQLAVDSDSNRLERFKLSFGLSKAAFKVDKFKNQLEETRHAELLKKCIDCLVAGLLIMSASLIYGAYVYSYQRISVVTTSCTTPSKESTSWFIPKSVSSFNSSFHMLRCQVVIASRMVFGVVMIVAIALLLLKRSSASNQTMPVTFILLLLGVLCGFAGKLCVDTLGGNGYIWLLYWEGLCLLHFFANTCTSTLFTILYGSVTVSQQVVTTTRLPYWIRQFTFYVTTLLWLPLFCGTLPFAGVSDWKEHISSLAADSILWSFIVDES